MVRCYVFFFLCMCLWISCIVGVLYTWCHSWWCIIVLPCFCAFYLLCMLFECDPYLSQVVRSRASHSLTPMLFCVCMLRCPSSVCPYFFSTVAVLLLATLCNTKWRASSSQRPAKPFERSAKVHVEEPDSVAGSSVAGKYR